jgi:hypothetical protein
MVEDEVWAAAGLGREDGFLCLSCLERRLGRWLRCEDFAPTSRENRQYWDDGDRMMPRAWEWHVRNRARRARG